MTELQSKIDALPDIVTLNGVEYRRIGPLATKISAHVMYDCHLFRRLNGTSVDELIADWRRECANPDPNYGAPYLCPVIVMDGDKELRRVGDMVFREGPSSWPETDDAVRDWKIAVESDPDIPRLLSAAKVSP